MRRTWFGALCVVVAVGSGRTSFAQANGKPSVAAAQERLDRGNTFFDQHNDGAALAEYLAGYEILRHPVFPYNIGRVYMTMGRYAKAMQWFEVCLAEPDKLTPAQRDNAAKWLEDERSFVGTIMVTSNVEGASVEVDHEEVAKTPMAKAIRVDAGTHHVAVLATDHAPKERDVMVAGQTERHENFELISWQHRVARLTISTNVPGADVLVDDVVVGKTPLLGTVKMVPGHHRIGVRRTGYVGDFREMTFDDGDAQTINFELKENVDWIGANGGSLVLRFSETHPMVTVNGDSRGEYLGSLRLAPGVHRLRAERAGFATVERDVVVSPGKTTEGTIRFQPNPDTLVKFKQGVDQRLTWGVVTTVGGVMMVGTGAAVRQFYSARREGDCLADSPSQFRCDTNLPGISSGTVVIAFGAGVFVTGMALIVSTVDRYRYDMKPSEQRLMRVDVLPTAGGIAVQVAGRF